MYVLNAAESHTLEQLNFYFMYAFPYRQKKAALLRLRQGTQRDNLLYGKGLRGTVTIILFFIKRMCLGVHVWVPMSTEPAQARDIQSSGIGATGNCELLEAGTGNGTQVLEKSITPSLQPSLQPPFKQAGKQANKNQCLT